jgi:hypothetical protein
MTCEADPVDLGAIEIRSMRVRIAGSLYRLGSELIAKDPQHIRLPLGDGRGDQMPALCVSETWERCGGTGRGL